MSEQSTTTTTTDATTTTTEPPVTTEQRGDDIEAMRRALAKANEEAKTARLKNKEFDKVKQELDELRASSMTDQEKAVAQARIEGKSEALKTANSRLVQANVEAVAAGKLADPSDAVAMIDLEQFEVDDNGNVDRKAIAAAIDKLVAKKPYLAVRTSGSFDGGARGTSSAGDDDMNARLRRAAGRD